MADVFTKKKRSDVMSKIRCSGNKATELRLIKIFKAWHITGWRRKFKLDGKPDFVFHRQRLAVFVDGCFWHGCPKHVRHPKSNQKYWRQKIARNIARDRQVRSLLHKKNWRILRVWEHDLRQSRESFTVRRIKHALMSS